MTTRRSSGVGAARCNEEGRGGRPLDRRRAIVNGRHGRGDHWASPPSPWSRTWAAVSDSPGRVRVAAGDTGVGVRAGAWSVPGARHSTVMSVPVTWRFLLPAAASPMATDEIGSAAMRSSRTAPSPGTRTRASPRRYADVNSLSVLRRSTVDRRILPSEAVVKPGDRVHITHRDRGAAGSRHAAVRRDRLSSAPRPGGVAAKRRLGISGLAILSGGDSITRSGERFRAVTPGPTGHLRFRAAERRTWSQPFAVRSHVKDSARRLARAPMRRA